MMTTNQPNQEGRKADAGKPRLSLLPWRAVQQIVAVMEFGAAKYGADNWQRVPEERWEQEILEVEENSTSAYLRLPNHDRSRIGMVGLPRLPKLRYRIVDGNLCVERRVEGA